MNLIRNKRKVENIEEKDNSNLSLKQVGEYQVTYHFNGNRTLEDCVSEYVRKKIKK